MIRLLLACLLLTALFLPHASGAGTAEVLTRAEARINAGDYDTAIADLGAMGALRDRPDEIRRLWALAMAHVRGGRPRAALPYLDRLVTLAPGDARFRLELAATLDLAGQPDRARYHFGLAQGADLPAPVAAEVARRIDRIDRARIWEGSFRFALAPESNPARRTAAETILIGDIPFTLKPGARAQPAQGVDLGFGLIALPRLGPDLRLRLGGNVDGRFYGGEAPDDVRARLELGLLHLGDRSRRIGAGLTYGRRWIDGAAYSGTTGGYLTWGRTLGARGRTQLSATLIREWTDYDRRPLARAIRSVAALQLGRVLTPRLELNLGLFLHRTDSDLPSEAGSGGGLTLGARYAFEGGILADLSLTLMRDERDRPDALLGITRKDTRRSLSLRLTHRDWAVGGFAPVMELGIERQKSTNALYSYENRRALIGLTRRF